MLRDGDNWLKSVIGKSFLLNNLVILAIVYSATALPFTIYLLSGYFSTLAHDYEEAAYIDGAGYSTTMWKIIFPMAKPSIITIILFNFLSFLECIYHFHDTDEFGKWTENVTGRIIKSDAGTAVSSTVWNYVCRTCNSNASYINFIYMCSE